MPLLVDLVAETPDVLAGLGSERGRDHPPGALPRERVKRVQHLLGAPNIWERDNIRHRRALLPATNRPRSSINREGTLPSSSPTPSTTFGYSPSCLRNWLKQDQVERRERPDGVTSVEREELKALRRENARLRQEKEILRKVVLAARRPPVLGENPDVGCRPVRRRRRLVRLSP